MNKDGKPAYPVSDEHRMGWPAGVPERLTDDQLDQWEASALGDHEAGQVWSVNPLAVLSVIRELRMYREWIVSEEAGPTFDDKADSGGALVNQPSTPSSRCGDFMTLVGMNHPVYCHLEGDHGVHVAAARIAGGGTAEIRWEDDAD